MSQIQYKVKTYYEDENCKISLEDVEGNVFVHVAFHKFSRSVLDKALRVWAEIKAKCYWLGYEHVYTYTFDKRMKNFFPGSKQAGEFVYEHKDYEVLQWDLN